MKPQYISMCRKAKEIQERGFPRGAQVVVKPYGRDIPRQTTGRIVGRDADYKETRASGRKPPPGGWYMVVVQGKIQALPKSNLVWIPDEGDLVKLYDDTWLIFDHACLDTWRALPALHGKPCKKVEVGLRAVMEELYGKEWDSRTKEWVMMK